MKKIQIVLKRINPETSEIYEEVVDINETIQQLNLLNKNLIEIQSTLCLAKHNNKNC